MRQARGPLPLETRVFRVQARDCHQGWTDRVGADGRPQRVHSHPGTRHHASHVGGAQARHHLRGVRVQVVRREGYRSVLRTR